MDVEVRTVPGSTNTEILVDGARRLELEGAAAKSLSRGLLRHFAKTTPTDKNGDTVEYGRGRPVVERVKDGIAVRIEVPGLGWIALHMTPHDAGWFADKLNDYLRR